MSIYIMFFCTLLSIKKLCYNCCMKIKIYRLVWIICLFVSLLLNIALALLMFYQISNTTESEDAIIFSICFLVLIVFNIFQIYSIIKSIKNGGVFLKGFLFNQDNQINKKIFIIINIVLLFAIIGLIYSILLTCGLDIYFSTLPKSLDYLMIGFFNLMMMDIIFADFYPLIEKDDN